MFSNRSSEGILASVLPHRRLHVDRGRRKKATVLKDDRPCNVPELDQPMERIKKQVFSALGSPKKRSPPALEDRPDETLDGFQIIVDWDLASFMRPRYESGDWATRLGSVITLTGSLPFTQAATCAEYMKQNWPSSGLNNMSEIQRALDAGPGQTTCGQYRGYFGKR